MQTAGISKQDFSFNPQKFVDSIRLKIFLKRIPIDDFCKMIGMKKSTYYSRINDPYSFHLDEVQHIYQILDLYGEDPLEINKLI